MTGCVWLASYPKSGNTWMRILLGALSLDEGGKIDINDLPEYGGIASSRVLFDDMLLFDSGLLTHDEIDRVRPRVYEELARNRDSKSIRMAKVHDAYLPNPQGEPLFAGARAANGAVVIVRDPRAVAPSLSNHNRISIDDAITFMGNPAAEYCSHPGRQYSQLRQKLPGWSGHVASWLDQRDIPVQLVRYEDLSRDTAGTLLAVAAFAGYSATREQAERAVRLSSFETLQSQERETGFGEWHNRHDSSKMFFRRGDAGGWRDELSAEQVARIEADHAAMMTRLGYELTNATGPAPA